MSVGCSAVYFLFGSCRLEADSNRKKVIYRVRLNYATTHLNPSHRPPSAKIYPPHPPPSTITTHHHPPPTKIYPPAKIYSPPPTKKQTTTQQKPMYVVQFVFQIQNFYEILRSLYFKILKLRDLYIRQLCLFNTRIGSSQKDYEPFLVYLVKIMETVV